MALGSNFSEWSRLTEEYLHGMEALRRKEPGASAKMMEIAQRMKQCEQLVCDTDAQPLKVPSPLRPVVHTAPRSASWITSTAELLFGMRRQDGLSLFH